jgi:hypothetical protein
MRIFAIIFLLLFSHQTLLALDLSRQTSFDERDICEGKNNAIWREFGNSCGDGCEMQFDEFKICDTSLALSCDCGEKRCWNGKTCVMNSVYKKIYDKKVKERQEKIAKEKEKRKADFEAQRQEILKKLIVENQTRAMSSGIEGAANNYVDAYKDVVEDIANSQIAQDAGAAVANSNQNLQNAVNDFNDKPIAQMPPTVANNGNANVPPAYLEQERLKQNAANANGAITGANGANPAMPALPVIPIPK